MRILIINTNKFDRNGMSSFVMNYIQAFRRQSVDVDLVYNISIDDDFRKELKNLSVGVKFLGPRNSNPIGYVKSLRNFAKKGNYDVVYVQGNSATLAVEAFALRNLNALVVMHAHGMTTNHPIINKLLKLYFLNHFDLGFAASHPAGDFLFSNKNYTVIKNAIDVSDYQFSNSDRQSFRKQLGIDSDTKLIVQLAAFTDPKNYPFTVQLAKQFQGVSNIKFLLFGEGANKEGIISSIEEEKIQRVVEVKPATSDVKGVLAAADGVIFPSLYESFGIVALEAQAMGVPVAVSDQFVSDLDITDEIDYLPLDADAWKRWIEELPIDKTRTVPVNHEKIIERGFDIQENAQQMLRIFERALSNK